MRYKIYTKLGSTLRNEVLKTAQIKVNIKFNVLCAYGIQKSKIYNKIAQWMGRRN